MPRDFTTGGKWPPFSEEVSTWIDLWALGRYDLNLGEEEFWGLTLKEFNALCERFKSNNERLDYRTALICAVLANTVRDPKRRKPFTPEDFMPKNKPKHQTAEQIFSTVQLLNTAFGGKVSEN